MRNNTFASPVVYMLEGFEELKNIYNEFYNQLVEKFESLYITKIDDLENNAPEILKSYINKVLSGKKYNIRELIFNNEIGRKYVKEMQNKFIKHSIKLVPFEYKIFNDLVILPNKVLITQFKNNRLFGVVIKSKSISMKLKALFAWVWKNSEEL